jgi:hypothetical protein
MTALDSLQRDCMALGTQLFTVTVHDFDAMLFRRIHSSHPVEYPAQGTKPMQRDAWFDLCITRGEVFVANTPEAFAVLYPDHALIRSMGLGAAVNIPLTGRTGRVDGTVNLLAQAGHFTPDRLLRYQALVTDMGPALRTLLLNG